MVLRILLGVRQLKIELCLRQLKFLQTEIGIFYNVSFDNCVFGAIYKTNKYYECIAKQYYK